MKMTPFVPGFFYALLCLAALPYQSRLMSLSTSSSRVAPAGSRSVP